MAPRSPHPKKIVTPSVRFWPDPGIFRQAWDLFIFSAAFAILFNLFYTYGIELRVPAPKAHGLSNLLASPKKDPVVYSGIKPSLSKTRTPSSLATATPADSLPHISLMGAKERFDSKVSLFLDARPSDEYAEGHIPGSLSFYADEFDKLAPTVLPKLTDKDREIITYCHGSSCELSVHLAKRLSELGYTRVKVFFGGWPEWKKAGYPVSAGWAP